MRMQTHERMLQPLPAECFDALAANQLAVSSERDFTVRPTDGEQVARRAVENETCRSMREAHRPTQRYARALRHADDRDLLERQLGEQLFDVGEIVLDAGRARRQAEAAAVECNQPIAVGKRGELRRPHVEIERPAMNEQHCRTFASRAHAQARAANLDELISTPAP